MLELSIGEARALALSLTDRQRRIEQTIERYGEAKIDSDENPGRAAYWDDVSSIRVERQRLETILEEVRFLGAEVKDLSAGLVDFYAERKTGRAARSPSPLRGPNGGELVFLCWQLGESKVAWWHPVEGGFGARKPITEF